MKKKTLFKDIFREIKKTKNRFISIMIITLLGTSFFVGLRMVSPDMKHTGDVYYDSANFYDVNIRSSYGFNDKDVNVIAANANISKLIPGYQTDLLFKNGEDKFVGKAYSLLSKDGSTIAKPEVLGGRLPESGNECFIGRKYFEKEGFQIGDSLKIAEHDGADIRYKELTITGYGNWPYYVTLNNYGTSKLGDGSAGTFVLIDESFFDSEVYTDLYITVAGAKELNSFSDEYTDKINSFKDDINPAVEERKTLRLKEEKEKAYKKIAKNQKKLDDKKEEAYNKLADAKAKLDSSERKLNDSEAKIKKEKKKLKQGKEDLQKAEATIKKNEAKLIKQDKALKQQEAEVQQIIDNYGEGAVPPETIARLKAARAEINKGKKEIEAGKKKIAGEKQSIKDGEKEIKKAEAEIKDGYAKIKKGRAEYEENKQKADKEFADAQKKIDKAKKKVDELKKPDWYVLDRKANESYFTYTENTDKINAIAQVFPLAFFLIAALVCLTTITRMVEEKRTELGTYKALGYGRWDISLKFILYAFIASFIGSIVGMIIGFAFLPVVINNAYRILFDTPDLITTVYLPYVFSSFAIGVLSTTLSAYAACRSSLREDAAHLMRPKLMKSGRKNIFERIPPLWKRLSFKWKITIRNLFRYKKRFLMSVVGVGACAGLLIAGFGIRYSVSAIPVLHYEEVMRYDVSITTDDELSDKKFNATLDEIKNNKYVKSVNNIFKENGYIVDGKDYSIQLIVPENDGIYDFIKLEDYYTKDKIKIEKDSVVISSRISKMLGISKGDEIIYKTYDNKQYTLKVSAVTNNYAGHFIYMNRDLYEEVFDKEYHPNTVLTKLSENSEEVYNKVTEDILSKDNVVSLVFNAREKDDYVKQMSSLDFVVMIIIIAAALLAFVVLFNLDNINVSERMRELATIKVLGFYNNEVNMYIARENIILTIIGIILGMFVGKYFHAYLMETVAVDFVQFYEGLTYSSYLYGAVLTGAFAFISNIFLRKKLKQIDMVSSLKSVE